MPDRKIENYNLTVTAGPTRDASSHHPVPVNTEKALHIDTSHVSADVIVRIQGFRNPDLPHTSPYFSTATHTNDKYSISFSPITFKEDVNGDDVVLGNDFDHPINKSLPPGFSVAWRVARWVVDPGLDGDPYAEKPWLEGRVLSSVNVIAVGDSPSKDKDALKENLGTKLEHLPKSENGGGEEIPHDAPARMKFFLNEPHRKNFVFKKGEKYHLDFYNPYIDFNEFALHLPGISIHILQYWDGQPLRYVLRNRVSGEVYGVVTFTLVEKEGAEKDDEDDSSSEEEEDEDAKKKAVNVDEAEAKKAVDNAKKAAPSAVETNDDDVD